MKAQSQVRSSSSAAPKRWLPCRTSEDEVQIKDENRGECSMCLRDEPNPVVLDDCGHRWCNACLDQHIRFLLGPEEVPARCCGKTIPVYKYSDILSRATLRKYLRVRTEKARQNNVPCAGSGCKQRVIRHYLVEDEWALCKRCYQVICGRCHRLRIHRKGAGEARICPTVSDLKVNVKPETADLTTTSAIIADAATTNATTVVLTTTAPVKSEPTATSSADTTFTSNEAMKEADDPLHSKCKEHISQRQSPPQEQPTKKHSWVEQIKYSGECNQCHR